MESEPTEEYRLTEDDMPQGSYQALGLSQVPTEESKSQKVFAFFANWGAVFAGITAFIVLVVWFFSVRFELDQAKEDISDNKANIELSRHAIQNIQISTTALERDVHYLGEKQNNINETVNEITQSLRSTNPRKEKE